MKSVLRKEDYIMVQATPLLFLDCLLDVYSKQNDLPFQSHSDMAGRLAVLCRQLSSAAATRSSPNPLLATYALPPFQQFEVKQVVAAVKVCALHSCEHASASLTALMFTVLGTKPLGEHAAHTCTYAHAPACTPRNCWTTTPRS